MKRIKWTCANCAGERVQIKVWINPNDYNGEMEAIVDGEHQYCNYCEEYVKLDEPEQSN